MEFTENTLSYIFGHMKSAADKLPAAADTKTYTRKVTYDLNPLTTGSDGFYGDLVKLTNIIIPGLQKLKSMAVYPYKEYRKLNLLDEVRSDDEYAFELLMLGILWKNHINKAIDSPLLAKLGLRYLYNLRRRRPAIKKYVDPVRGLLSSLFLYKRRTIKGVASQMSLRHLSSLLLWLEASGEYKQEAARLRFWEGFFSRLPEPYMEEMFGEVMFQVELFEINAERILGIYGANIDTYLIGFSEHYFGREDALFCSRGRNEYYMNMLGAEIINRALKGTFKNTRKKVVLTPACMRKYTDKRCKAKNDGLDLICTGCAADCGVNRLVKSGISSGFSVRLIPHSSDFTAWLEQWRDTKEIGVVGVACVLNLLTGGYEMQSMNIPAQCVFLDYAGCTNHWCGEHCPTVFSMNQLEKVLN